MESYISELTTSYMPWRAGQYAKHGLEFCLGSKTDASHFVEDGAIQFPWGAAIDPGQFSNVRLLRLIPSKSQLKKAAIPEFIRELPNLEFLALPLPLAVKLTPEFIKPSLKGLDVQNTQGSIEALGKTQLMWPGVVCPNVRSLRLMDDAGSTEIDTLFGISDPYFPLLEYLMINVDKRGRRLPELAHLSGLKVLHLEFVRDHAVFNHIGASLRALSIVNTGSKFNLGDLVRVRDVEFLWLNGLQCEIDCAVFAELPNLREVNLLNSKKIKNIEALLNCGKLESIYALNCGRPFSKEAKQLFAARGYKRLEIESS